MRKTQISWNRWHAIYPTARQLSGVSTKAPVRAKALREKIQPIPEPRPTTTATPYNCATALLEISFCRTIKINNNTPITIFVHQLFKVPLKLINV